MLKTLVLTALVGGAAANLHISSLAAIITALVLGGTAHAASLAPPTVTGKTGCIVAPGMSTVYYPGSQAGTFHIPGIAYYSGLNPYENAQYHGFDGYASNLEQTFGGQLGSTQTTSSGCFSSQSFANTNSINQALQKVYQDINLIDGGDITNNYFTTINTDLSISTRTSDANLAPANQTTGPTVTASQTVVGQAAPTGIIDGGSTGTSADLTSPLIPR